MHVYRLLRSKMMLANGLGVLLYSPAVQEWVGPWVVIGIAGGFKVSRISTFGASGASYLLWLISGGALRTSAGYSWQRHRLGLLVHENEALRPLLGTCIHTQAPITNFPLSTIS